MVFVFMLWSGPASATGAWLVMVITTSSGVRAGRLQLSVTVRVKVSTAGSEGAVKVGVTAVILLNVTAGPPVCAHR